MKQGQSIVEYAVLICIIIACLIAMQVYAKRQTEQKNNENKIDKEEEIKYDVRKEGY